jgi:hypothetical protein
MASNRIASHVHPAAVAALALIATAFLAACGGGQNAAVGGAVSGLMPGASVTLQNNAGDNLTITADQAFTFATSIAPGGGYNVTVLTQPVGESCVVANGAGTIDSEGDDVTNVAVTCTQSSSVGGTVSGLAMGESVWLTTNGVLLPIAANGPFAFPGVLPDGTAYDVTVSTQPAQQTCTVASPSGVVAAGTIAQVAVTCQ